MYVVGNKIEVSLNSVFQCCLIGKKYLPVIKTLMGIKSWASQCSTHSTTEHYFFSLVISVAYQWLDQIEEDLI